MVLKGNYVVVNGLATVSFKNPLCLSSLPVRPHIIEKEVYVYTDTYPHGSSPTLRCTVRGFPMPAQIEWQWMSKEDCPEAFQ